MVQSERAMHSRKQLFQVLWKSDFSTKSVERFHELLIFLNAPERDHVAEEGGEGKEEGNTPLKGFCANSFYGIYDVQTHQCKGCCVENKTNSNDCHLTLSIRIKKNSVGRYKGCNGKWYRKIVGWNLRHSTAIGRYHFVIMQFVHTNCTKRKSECA